MGVTMTNEERIARILALQKELKVLRCQRHSRGTLRLTNAVALDGIIAKLEASRGQREREEKEQAEKQKAESTAFRASRLPGTLMSDTGGGRRVLRKTEPFS